MPDQTDSSWRPEYTGDESLGDVGSGPRFGAYLYYLYRAGRNELPRVAEVYSGLTSTLYGIEDDMRALFDAPGTGMTIAHVQLLELRDEIHHAFYRTNVVMQQVGDALIEIAASYAATDEAAVAEFSDLLDKAYEPGAGYEDWRPDPPTVSDPVPVDGPEPPPQAGPLYYY